MAMDYLYKFRTGLFTAVEAVQSALPGNPVLRELIVGHQVASAGPGLVWKVYAAKKKSTGQAVSAWIFEKKSLDRMTKGEKEAFLDLLRQGVSKLTRLRHPRVLTVDTALDEARDSLAFCTEPIWSSLANITGRIDNIENLPKYIQDVKFESVEIKYGIMQLAEALAFLHNDARQLHRNICPDSIIINERGDWKLAAFDFAVQAIDRESTSNPTYPCILFDQSVDASQQPQLDYIAPECLITESPSSTRITSSADMYSLGCLCVALFDHPRHEGPFNHQNKLKQAKRNMDKLRNSVPASCLVRIPDQFKDDVKMCLFYSPELRPDATQLTKVAFFDDVQVKTLRYFESLCQMDGVQKAQFFKGLLNVLPQFPTRVLTQKVMYWCAAETRQTGQADLVPFILPCIFFIADRTSEQEYELFVLPHLIPIFQMRHPYQVPLMLLQKMELLLSKTPDDQVKQHVLPLIYLALESDTARVQELCLGIIPTVGKLVDRDSMKAQLLPKLLRLATDGQVLSVKVNSLLCLGKLIPTLEKWMITEQILPALPKVNSKEPGVLMAVLGIYNMVFHSKDSINKDICAKSALPCLMSNSVDNSLNVNQFDQHIKLIREMIDKVYVEHRQRLSTLSAMQEDQRSVRDFNEVLSESSAKMAIPTEMSSLAMNSAQATNGVQSLSLEEKKRLAATKEGKVPVTSPPTLKPQPMWAANPLMPSHQSTSMNSGALNCAPKDLTAMLMKTPISSMEQSRPTMQQMMQPQTSSMGEFGNFATLNANPQPVNWTNASPNSNINWGMTTMTPQVPPNMTSTNKFTNKAVNSNTKSNISAFDDLVSLPSKNQGTVSLNQLKK